MSRSSSAAGVAGSSAAAVEGLSESCGSSPTSAVPVAFRGASADAAGAGADSPQVAPVGCTPSPARVTPGGAAAQRLPSASPFSSQSSACPHSSTRGAAAGTAASTSEASTERGRGASRDGLPPRGDPSTDRREDSGCGVVITEPAAAGAARGSSDVEPCVRKPSEAGPQLTVCTGAAPAFKLTGSSATAPTRGPSSPSSSSSSSLSLLSSSTRLGRRWPIVGGRKHGTTPPAPPHTVGSASVSATLAPTARTLAPRTGSAPVALAGGGGGGGAASSEWSVAVATLPSGGSGEGKASDFDCSGISIGGSGSRGMAYAQCAGSGGPSPTASDPGVAGRGGVSGGRSTTPSSTPTLRAVCRRRLRRASTSTASAARQRAAAMAPAAAANVVCAANALASATAAF